MTKYAIVNEQSIITEIGEREDLEPRTGRTRELVELTREHSEGDSIEYGPDGVES